MEAMIYLGCVLTGYIISIPVRNGLRKLGLIW